MSDEPILSLNTADISTSPKVQRKEAEEASAKAVKRQRDYEQLTMRKMAGPVKKRGARKR